MNKPEVTITKSSSEVNDRYDVITEKFTTSRGNIVQLIYDEYEDSWRIVKPDFHGHNQSSFYFNERYARRNFEACMSW